MFLFFSGKMIFFRELDTMYNLYNFYNIVKNLWKWIKVEQNRIFVSNIADCISQIFLITRNFINQKAWRQSHRS